MKRKQYIYIILTLLAACTILAYLFWPTKKRFDWRESYHYESKEPYGTFVVKELLQNYFPDQSFRLLQDSIYGALPTSTDTLSNFVFIGQAMLLDSTDLNALLQFVADGNRAFIASKTLPNELANQFDYGVCDYYWDDYWGYQDTMVQLTFAQADLNQDSAYQFQYLWRNKASSYEWHYMDPEFFCDSYHAAVPLAYYTLDSIVHFAQINYGEGSFFLHTIPLAFTNVQLLEDQGIAYADGVFSHLHEGPIYWDAYSHVSERLGRSRNDTNYGNRKLSGDSPLSYILSQPALAWAWYLLLAMAALYLLFRAKRKQAIVPVLAPNTNTSLEFLSTIGRLYFIQNNHRQLILQQMRLLLAFIRERYHLHTKALDTTFVEKLATKSEIEQAHLSKLLLMYQNIKQSNFVSDQTFIDFHQLVDHFYKNCK
ncbi:MAG: DUF4350 domain-containing protein [Bacteroidota bacterium]